MKLRDRTAIITGAGGGLGRCHALELARHGARIVVNDLDAGNAGRVADEINAGGGEAIGVAGSVTDEREVAAMVERAMAEWGASTSSSTTPESCATRASPRWIWRIFVSSSTCI